MSIDVRVKAIDFLLLAVAVGLTLLNALLLTSQDPRDFADPMPADDLAPRAPRNLSFRNIVVHDLHPGSTLSFHFVIGDGTSFPDGAIVPTELWRKQEGSDSLEIALASGHTEKQEQALVELIRRLQRDYEIPPNRVGLHREIDPDSKCPPEIDGDALREKAYCGC